MKVLHLTLKRKWFEMILSGQKKEEYREIKHYWSKRFKHWTNHTDMLEEFDCEFTHVKFTNGYGKNAPTLLIEFNGIRIGKAKPEWSDNWQGDVFIITLGNIIN